MIILYEGLGNLKQMLGSNRYCHNMPFSFRVDLCQKVIACITSKCKKKIKLRTLDLHGKPANCILLCQMFLFKMSYPDVEINWTDPFPIKSFSCTFNIVFKRTVVYF